MTLMKSTKFTDIKSEKVELGENGRALPVKLDGELDIQGDLSKYPNSEEYLITQANLE